MVDPRDDNRENFIMNENHAEEPENLDQEEYYAGSSEVFGKKSFVPFIIGGVAFVVLVIVFAVILLKPESTVDQDYLQSLETRIDQLENKLATTGAMDPILERLGRQEQKLDTLETKLAGVESTATTQIDQIIKELGVLHQKTSHYQGPGKPPQKIAEKKQPLSSGKTDSKKDFYQVQSGDTLYRISRQHGLSVEQLQKYNNLSPDADIYPGQKLKLSPN